MLLAINKEVAPPEIYVAAADTPLEGEVGMREYLQYVNEDFLASQSSAKQA